VARPDPLDERSGVTRLAGCAPTSSPFVT
jgi:hypothetical protein